MGFLQWLRGSSGVQSNANQGVVPESVGLKSFRPGDPDGVEFVGDLVEGRALPALLASPWSGWPAGWATPEWSSGGQKLVDAAWMALDLNASVLSTMPVYKTRGGRVVEPESWMVSPDPRVYASWHEFAKSLFWDYQLGEAFVLATDYYSTGYPMFMRVLPPWAVTVDGLGENRRYRLGSVDITADVLHIRYKSSLDSPRGVGPLDSAGCRLTAVGVMSRYVAEMVTAPPPYMTIETDQPVNKDTAEQILSQWVESRRLNAGHPAVLGSGAELKTHQMNARDMALLELAQFSESRVVTLLGVPPFIVGLPSGGDSMTYSNVSSLFTFHDRASLQPKATAVMAALSNWALPRGQTVELDREEYSRPGMLERAQAWQTLAEIPDVVSGEEIRDIERDLLSTGRPAQGVEPPGGEP